MKKDKRYCAGCDSDFYNNHNPIGVEECWHLEKAKVVTKYSIGWWIPQDDRTNFSKVRTYNCHTETGKRAFYDKLPSHLR